MANIKLFYIISFSHSTVSEMMIEEVAVENGETNGVKHTD